MADAVDADELLRRIRGARDWAIQEEGRLLAEAEAASGPDGAAVPAEAAKAFSVVRSVLDKIIEPGRDPGTA
ncbi:hypothetical protein ACIA78_23495 [Streptomyces xanthochromogenes]|uniref:hypothetical protein n=1 Tax=Streptomyces xanthochromogenes TaxID=67384 RepID=UPI00378B7BE4